MHTESMRLMRDFAKRYGPFARVLDVGSLDVNGSFRSLFPGAEYVGADVRPGKNVDVVMGDPHAFPFGDASFDAVVSGSCLEHDPRFWVTLAEIGRVSSGCACVVAPGAGPYHAHTEDYWRFMTDAPRAWAEASGMELVESGQCGGTWADCWAVMRRRRAAPPRQAARPAGRAARTGRRDGDGHVAVIREIVAGMAAEYGAIRYLELGVGNGQTFNSVAPLCGEAWAVDSSATMLRNIRTAANVCAFEATTDAFFAERSGKVGAFDIIFIDAWHEAGQALRDFHNSMAAARDGGLVLLHDGYPPNRADFAMSRSGTVWKTVSVLRDAAVRGGFEVVTLPFASGVTVVRKADRQLMWEGAPDPGEETAEAGRTKLRRRMSRRERRDRRRR